MSSTMASPRQKAAFSTAGAGERDYGIVAGPADGMCADDPCAPSDGGDLCFEPAQKVKKTGYKRVGEGRGGYAIQETYQYVGPQQGKYERPQVQSADYGTKVRQFGIGFIIVACLAAAYLLAPRVWAKHLQGLQAVHEQVMISTPAATVAPVTVAPVMSPVMTGSVQTFNCEDGYASWQTAWNEDKQDWCCKFKQRACPEPPKYDCSVPQNQWHFAQKAWCCLHTRQGCPPTTPPPTAAPVVEPPPAAVVAAPPPPAVSSAPTSGCDAPCTIEGKFGPQTATCSSRIQWAAEHRFVEDPNRCEAAHTIVLQECSACASCSLADLGCSPPSTPAPVHNCLTTVPVEQWSPPKKAYCCQLVGRGCPSSTEPAHDCNAGLENWARGWSVAKKAWCCTHAGHGCAPEAPTTQAPTTAPSAAPAQGEDCTGDYDAWAAKWSDSKKKWCCTHEKRGCPSLYDCDAGFSNWAKGWTTEKKAWCCYFKGKACGQTQTKL